MIAQSLRSLLAARHIHPEILESDELRKILTPQPSYSDDERDAFYRQMIWIGTLLTRNNVPVIFDATAIRRIWREQAREQIGKFLEVCVECPLEVCMARDPKGIYRRAREGAAGNVPGLQAAYEPPDNPDLVVHGDTESPDTAAMRILAKLEERGCLYPS